MLTISLKKSKMDLTIAEKGEVMNKIFVVYDTDIGIKKKTNQDSMLLKGYSVNNKDVLLAVICDGMGGMEKGELASATVVRAFSDWFEKDYMSSNMNVSDEKVSECWQNILENANKKLIAYGKENQLQLGTTVSAVLLDSDGHYLFGHVGDTRIYKLSETLHQLTEDHTFIAREIKRGNMTIEEAKKDNRRNVLLQCIGVNEFFEPQYENGRLDSGAALLLCSDGFRHMLSEDEIYESLNPHKNLDEAQIKEKLREMIEWNKQRMETDNISAIYIKLK